MKFGKLQDLTGVDFSLPPLAEATQNLFSEKTQQKSDCQILIGCPSWSSKDWIGKIYPQGTKSKDFLKHYAKSFDSIELNTTYYRTPKAETLQGWSEKVHDTFRFCPKISQQISHYRRLNNVRLLTEEFCAAFDLLGEKLGPFFLQLPPNFSSNEADKLENFIDTFPLGYQLAVEFRHETWFTDQAAFNNLANLLQEKGMMTCISDVAGRRDVLHQRITNPELMLRFVGNQLHQTDYTRVDDWVDTIAHLAERGLEKVYFFIHQPEEIECPELGVYLVKKLKAVGLSNVKNLLYKTGGVQSTLF